MDKAQRQVEDSRFDGGITIIEIPEGLQKELDAIRILAGETFHRVELRAWSTAGELVNGAYLKDVPCPKDRFIICRHIKDRLDDLHHDTFCRLRKKQ